jgi:hypothetical protein
MPVLAAASMADLRRGCAETLEALAMLAPELSDRFQNGRDVPSWFRPRDDDQTRNRQLRRLELLAVASSWEDWQDISRETTQWRGEDDAAWTRAWFGGLLAQLQSTVSLWNQLPPEAAEALIPLRDEITGPLGVRAFQDVRVENILALAPAEREPVWNALVSLARLLSGYCRHADWHPWLETAWDPLPLSALVEFEVADHARARLPYFLRRLQVPLLWSASDGEEVKLSEFKDAPPPTLARDTFFPEPMSIAIARQLHRLSNSGIRAWLVSSIPGLLQGLPSPATAPSPVGPPLLAPAN